MNYSACLKGFMGSIPAYGTFSCWRIVWGVCDAHDPRPALPQAQSTEFRAVNRNPIPKFADSLVANSQKSCQCFFRESDKSRKLSYNARARAHPSVATLLSELYLPYAPRLENSMLQKPRLNSSARSNRFKRAAGDGR